MKRYLLIGVIILIIFGLAGGYWVYVRSISNDEVGSLSQKDTSSSSNSVNLGIVPDTNDIAGEYLRDGLDVRKDDSGNGAMITVTSLGDNNFQVDGYASWGGTNASIGGVNVGEFSGIIRLNGISGTYSDEYCEIDMTFYKDSLTAKDNLGCGGLNVSFTGEYLKSP